MLVDILIGQFAAFRGAVPMNYPRTVPKGTKVAVPPGTLHTDEVRLCW